MLGCSSLKKLFFYTFLLFPQTVSEKQNIVPPREAIVWLISVEVFVSNLQSFNFLNKL